MQPTGGFPEVQTQEASESVLQILIYRCDDAYSTTDFILVL